MKITEREILLEFQKEKPRKKVFGNYRIDGNRLVYRAQSSDEVRRWYDQEEFRDFLKTTGEKIRDFDGKLTDSDGKTIMLEALEFESKVGKMRLVYYETETVALKLKCSDTGKTVFFGNSKTLELIGRTVAYGRESRNRHVTEIQEEMRSMGFSMVDLETLKGFETFKVLSITEPRRVEYLKPTRRYGLKDTLSAAFYRSILFDLGEKRFLSSVDEREASQKNLVSFCVEVPSTVKDITEAFQSFVPESISRVDARLGSMFFEKCDTPTLPVLTDSEKIVLLAHLAKNNFRNEQSLIDAVSGLKGYTDLEVESLLEKVPKEHTENGYQIETHIRLGGTDYVRGLVKCAGLTDLKLGQWHTMHRKATQ